MASHQWLIYALGGGLGHLTRACALALAALPDTCVRILTNSPYAAWVQRAAPELDISADQGPSEILREIAFRPADCLIVDTFPRGLVGELASVLPTFRGLKVFVQRDLNPQYVRNYNLNTFVANTYDLVLSPGDANPDSLGPFLQTVNTAPWLARSVHELPSRHTARRLLDLHEDKPCILVCAAGNPEEQAWYREVASQLERASQCDIRWLGPGSTFSYWPAMDLYPAVDVVIGGAGYNTVYECVACAIPLVAKAWSRKYDRQYLRASRASRSVDEPIQAVTAALEMLGTPRPNPRHLYFENGSSSAVTRIRQQAGNITTTCHRFKH